MSSLQDSYSKIYALFELEPMNNFLNQIRQPKLSDKQLIALALASEGLGIDSERYLFKQLPAELKVQCCLDIIIQIKPFTYSHQETSTHIKGTVTSLDSFQQDISSH